MCTPVFPNIKKAWPNARVDMLVEEASAPLVRNNPAIDSVVVLPRKTWERMPAHTAWIESLRFIRRLRSARYDLVIDLFGNPRSAFLTGVSGAPVKAGFAFRGRKVWYNTVIEPRGDQVHEVEFNLDALRRLKIPVSVKDPQIFASEQDYSYVDTWLSSAVPRGRRVLGIHAWASWPAKAWPGEYFSRLARAASSELNMSVVMLWGPGEKQHAENIAEAADCGVLIAPPTSLTQLAALMSRFTAVAATDSGPMHIAAAMNTPTLGIFGPTNRDLQGPWGPASRVVYNKDLDCLGCNLTRCSMRTCMNGLSPEQVLEELKKLVEHT